MSTNSTTWAQVFFYRKALALASVFLGFSQKNENFFIFPSVSLHGGMDEQVVAVYDLRVMGIAKGFCHLGALQALDAVQVL